MFLVVFVTLMISIIGLYAQVLGLQANRINNAQVGLMQTMVTWHEAATNLALRDPPVNNTLVTGCQMTSATTLSGIPVCTDGTGNVLVNGNLPNGTAALPPGYLAGVYPFMSVVYKGAGGLPSYVITYVHDADASNNIYLPNNTGNTVGYSIFKLSQQFARAAPAGLAYGMVVTAGTLPVITNSSIAQTLSYSIPPTTILPGSLAIISVAQ